MKLRIRRIELRRVEMPLRFRFETSFGAMTEKSFLLAQVFTEDGTWGIGECVAEDDPYYLPETNGTVTHIIRDFLAPLVLAHEFTSPEETDGLFAAIRGHEMAKAALEMAIWDLFARAKGEPLWKTLGGDGREFISAGVSIGLQPDVASLMARVRIEVASGYQRIKIKIKPGRDLELVHAIRAEFPQIRLMVDANSAYTLEQADTLRAFDPFHLMMIEQPLAWNDIIQHAKLQEQIATPVCLDESITSPAAAESAISIGACGIINIKAGRVGGLVNSRAHPGDRGVAPHSRLVRRHARVGNRPARERPPPDPARFHASRRHVGECAVLRGRPDRAGGRGRRSGAHRRAGRPGARARDRVAESGSRHSSPRRLGPLSPFVRYSVPQTGKAWNRRSS
jgi:O-succinylbenzoate synthase